jgi:hypothetical protein
MHIPKERRLLHLQTVKWSNHGQGNHEERWAPEMHGSSPPTSPSFLSLETITEMKERAEKSPGKTENTQP